jgi:tRNA modification GTPase
LINSKSDKENKASLKQLEGVLGENIRIIKNSIIDLLVDIEANIDYPEYDIEEVRREKIVNVLKENIDKLAKLEKSFDSGKILKDGILTAIVGKPNVGKSSLLNRLVKEERAIVTEIAGTTRDTIEEYITINGVPLKLIDTAGIHETKDIVEEIGVNKSKKALNEADLVLMMLDSTKELSEEDKELLECVKNKKHIVLINKIDVGNILRKEMFEDRKVIEISTKTLDGIDELENEIERLFNVSEIQVENEIIVTNVRHKNFIIEAKKGIENAVNSVKNGLPVDMLSIDLQDAIQNLGEIIGESISEEVVKGIFAKFCVGK